jgi:hypothetical protein
VLISGRISLDALPGHGVVGAQVFRGLDLRAIGRRATGGRRWSRQGVEHGVAADPADVNGLGGQALEYDRIGVTAIAGDHPFARVWQRLAKLLDAGERDDLKPLLFFSAYC